MKDLFTFTKQISNEIQKQPPEVFCKKKDVLWKFRKIHTKTPSFIEHLRWLLPEIVIFV